MRKTLFALSLLLASSLLAQTADVRITVASISNTPTKTGDRIALSTRWQNDGPATAHFINVTVVGTPTPNFVLAHATTSWPCYPNPEGDVFRCQHADLLPGQEAGLVVQMTAPPTAGPFNIRIAISASEDDPNPANNVVNLPFTLTAAPSTDLSMTPTSQVHRAQSGAEVTIPYVVANNGDHAISNLTAVFTLPVLPNIPPMSAIGTDWSCQHPSYGPEAVVCTRTSLAAGASAPITLTTTAPADGETFVIHSRVGGENYSDPLLANNSGTATITTAEEVETWNRVLLPLIGPDVPGAGGALWRTEVTGFIESDTPIEVRPDFCEFVLICPPVVQPLRTPFDVYGHGVAGFVGAGLGQFVYLREADEPKLHLNARVYDVSRTAETAGSEIPIVREHDFTHGTISLLGIPVATQFRHTLRVYDLDGRDGAQVAIRIYANEETTPRLSVTRTLTAPDTVTIGDRPIFPATTQFEIGQLVSLTGIETLRVDVEPLDDGLRIWSFVSVTNNDTHHVTTFSAQ
ncbi:MAG TPA: hypothetical protein VF215_17535 [Thermoanaerobaculia bacterium]